MPGGPNTPEPRLTASVCVRRDEHTYGTKRKVARAVDASTQAKIAGQNGFTTAKITIPIIRNVGISLAKQ